MTNLVWDDSRIQELADLVNTTVWQYLEQFNVDVDAFKVAHKAELATKDALIDALVDGTEPHSEKPGVCRHCGNVGLAGQECDECEPRDGLGPMILQEVRS